MVPFLALIMLLDFVWIGEFGVSQLPAWVVLGAFWGASYATIQGFRAIGTLWRNHRKGQPSPVLEWVEVAIFGVSQGVAPVFMGGSEFRWWAAALFMIGLGLASTDLSWLRWKRGQVGVSPRDP